MKKAFCDNCGTELTNKNDPDLVLNRSIMLEGSKVEIMVRVTPSNADLCSDCVMGFIDGEGDDK